VKRRILLSSAFALSFLAPASSTAQQPYVDPIRVDAIAEKLGTKPGPSTPREIELGQSATLTLTNPDRLASQGIKGMHEGARVTLTCVGPGRLRIEVDELQPVAKNAVLNVKLIEDGTFTPIPDRLAAQPKPREP
jgi:hypothetical protein